MRLGDVDKKSIIATFIVILISLFIFVVSQLDRPRLRCVPYKFLSRALFQASLTRVKLFVIAGKVNQ